MKKLMNFPEEYIQADNLPSELKETDLRTRLSWLYFEIFEEMPFVCSTFPDKIISAYSRRYIKLDNNQDFISIMFKDATETQRTFPNTLQGMYEQSRYGSWYSIFATPAMFYIPQLFFLEKDISFSPYDYLIPYLRNSIFKYFEKDQENL